MSGEQLQDAVPAVVAVGSRWDIWETSKLLIFSDLFADLLDDLLAVFFRWRFSFSCCLLLSFAIDRGLMMIDDDG